MENFEYASMGERKRERERERERGEGVQRESAKREIRSGIRAKTKETNLNLSAKCCVEVVKVHAATSLFFQHSQTYKRLSNHRTEFIQKAR